MNSGAKTADPALPYSKAFISCGRILCLHMADGKESNDGVKLLKNLFFSVWSFIYNKKYKKSKILQDKSSEKNKQRQSNMSTEMDDIKF